MPPTAAELRGKYLENISRMVDSQSKYVSYKLSIGKDAALSDNNNESPPPTDGADENGDSKSSSQSLLPMLALEGGKIEFNSTVAADVPTEEDIRARGDLWTITWSASPSIFMHRSDARKLVASQKTGESGLGLVLPVTLTKVPTSEGMASEGSEMSCTGWINISDILTPGTTLANATITDIKGGDFDLPDVTCTASFQASLEVNVPLVPASAATDLSNALSQGKGGKVPQRPSQITSKKNVGTENLNRDVVEELRDELAKIIRLIAAEYVTQYPATVPVSEGGGGVSLSEKRADFMHYLSSNGIYHSFKEQLKPRIQRIVRDKFGARGKALGKDQLGNSAANTGSVTGAVAAMGGGEEEEGREGNGLSESHDSSSSSSLEAARKMDLLLGELYVFLVKECNFVLNSIYTRTVVDRDTLEIEKSATIDDETETPVQTFNRLLLQANDSEAAGRMVAAEQAHLERVQLLSQKTVLGTDHAITHDAYARYGEFLLRLASATLLQTAGLAVGEEGGELPAEAAALVSAAGQHVARAREALTLAVKVRESEWKVSLLLACVLIEADQPELAEPLLLSSINTQLKKADRGGKLQSLDEFDGYETDKLTGPVDPTCYCVLAALYSLLNKPLNTRKSLRLANTAFVEAGCLPPVETHGTPRRTLVLTLAQSANYLFGYGLFKLGKECRSLAMMCETAVTDKAKLRNLNTVTVPFIRHLLLRSLANSMLLEAVQAVPTPSLVQQTSTLENVLLKVQESIEAAVDPADIISGYVCASKIMIAAKKDSASILEALTSAISAATSAGMLSNVPLESILLACKLLINSGRYREALSIAMLASSPASASTSSSSPSSATPSSSLFLLIGVACLRLDRLEDAEDALQEANLLDNRNPEIWSYLTLLLLTAGQHRREEADKCLFQALRLGLSNPSLLREIATCYVGFDQLQVAEDLVRRCIQSELAEGEGARASAHTRKLLADILVSQNLAIKAVEEYKNVVADDAADMSLRLSAAKECVNLLGALGRLEEKESVKRIVESLSQSSQAVQMQ